LPESLHFGSDNAGDSGDAFIPAILGVPAILAMSLIPAVLAML
jgi:hypothetical protein